MEVLLVAVAVGGIIVAVLQYRGRKAAQARAERAKDVRNRMASELEGAREEYWRASCMSRIGRATRSVYIGAHKPVEFEPVIIPASDVQNRDLPRRNTFINTYIAV